MNNLNIPPKARPGFEAITKLSEEQLQQLSIAIRDIPVGTIGEKYQKYLRETLPDLPDIHLIGSALYSFCNFLALTPDKDVLDIIKSLAIAYYSSPEFKDSLKDNEEVSQFILHIATLAGSFGNLLITAKANQLLMDCPSVYIGSKIISDIRLVFNDDIKSFNRHALILHQLEIVVSNDTQDKQYYVSLDYSNLIELKAVIERALEKNRLIEEHYGNTMKFIRIEEN